AGANWEYLNLLLNLEASVGLRVGYPDPGDPEKDPAKKRVIKGALERRQDLYKRDPTNATNNIALARLYIDLRRWDDARKLIESLRTAGDSLEVSLLDARFYAEHGEADKTLSLMNDYLSRQSGEPSAEPFIAFAQLLAELRRP